MTAYIQSTENAFEERIGAHGLGQRAFEDVLARADGALDLLRKQYSDGSLPLLRYGEKSDDISEIKSAAAALSNGATDIVVLGTGGSSLGGQTLAQIASYHVPGVGQERGPKLHFMDNLDSETFARLLQELPLATARFVPISKSGGTAETLMQTIAALSAVKQAGLEQRIPELFFGISEPARDGKRNGLRSLLAQHRIPMLEHDTGVGGRFSVLTNVGLLPAAALGLDIEAVRRGAQDTLAPVLSKKPANEIAPAIGAALSIGLAEQRGKSISVIMAYSDRLERLTRWYVQLWAESLGKDGKGTTPLAALGPVDQHSQLQLFIAGPRDKFFTILTTGNAKAGPPLDRELAALAGEPDLGGRRIGDLVAVQGRATADTLAKNGCAVRTIHIEQINEHSIGALLMHFMLETIIAAHLLGVDAFDQPAVEEGKILAKQYLKAGQT